MSGLTRMTKTDCPAGANLASASVQAPNCSQKQEQRGFPVVMARIMGLETASDMLGGKASLAQAIGVSIRALNYKLNAERGVSDFDVTFAAKALDAKAKAIADHAAKLRAELTSCRKPVGISTDAPRG
jgi:hypothetical protein